MSLRRYIARRLLLLLPQMLGILLVTFLLVRLIPGNPARVMLGPQASAESVANLEQELGYHEPLPTQFWLYLKRAVQGDFGTSWQSGRPVLAEVLERLPATLELLLVSFVLALLIAVPLGVASAARPRGAAARLSVGYRLVAGAIPEFWLGIMLIFIFYSQLGLVTAPDGQIDATIAPPTRITGAYAFDSLVTGNFTALSSSLQHLILPVATMTIVIAAPVLKMTRGTMLQMLEADFSSYGRLCGLSERSIRRAALRNSLPPIVTLVASLFSILIGGAVLVEQVFGWGGAGQYVVQGVLNSDFAVVQGFVVVAALLTALIYLLVDIAYVAIDPRLTY